MNTENTLWQSLMDGAYSRWNTSENMSYRDMLAKCSKTEKVAVLLGNLNYQVENGGFEQWVDNGYALHGDDVVEVLREIAKSEKSEPIKLLSSKIAKLMNHVDTSKPDRGFGTDYWNEPDSSRYGDYDSEDDYEEEDCEGRILAREMDDWYYKIQSEIVPVIKTHLAKLNENNI